MSTERPDLADILDVLVLERQGDGSFRFVPPIPAGFAELGYTDIADVVQPGRLFDFLDTFLPEAETAVWNNDQPARLASGPWSETRETATGTTDTIGPLEAHAVRHRDRNYLLVERIDARYAEHQSILQQSREVLLIKQRLERELERQKQLEARLVEERLKADDANRAKSDFLGAMSHELRTPLNAILGFAQVLELDPKAPLSDRQASRVALIIDSGQHLLQLIEQLLDLSRIEAGSIDLAPEDIALQPLIQEVATMMTGDADKRSIRLMVAEPLSGLVLADPMRLKQILINLVSNAIKYNDEGGTVTIGVDPAAAAGIRIVVTDDGAGIPADRVDEIFTPFARLGRELGDIEGTGVGLSISKMLIEAMDGKIGFESTEGTGSRFWIDLPRTHPG